MSLENVTVYFHGAKWCSSCVQVKPKVEAVCAKFGAQFRYVDVDVEDPIVPNIWSLPTLVVTRPGSEPLVMTTNEIWSLKGVLA